MNLKKFLEEIDIDLDDEIINAFISFEGEDNIGQQKVAIGSSSSDKTDALIKASVSLVTVIDNVKDEKLRETALIALIRISTASMVGMSEFIPEIISKIYEKEYNIETTAVNPQKKNGGSGWMA